MDIERNKSGIKGNTLDIEGSKTDIKGNKMDTEKEIWYKRQHTGKTETKLG